MLVAACNPAAACVFLRYPPARSHYPFIVIMSSTLFRWMRVTFQVYCYIYAVGHGTWSPEITTVGWPPKRWTSGFPGEKNGRPPGATRPTAIHIYIYILTVRQVLILRTYVGTNLPDQDVRFTHRLEQHRHSKCMVFSMWDTKAHIERDTTNIEQSLQLHIEHVEG